MIIDTRNWQGDNIEYMHNGLLNVITRVDLEKLGVERVQYAQSLQARGHWVAKDKTVLLNPNSKSFWPNYKGYQYKKFGGRKDLTPGGVFAHECGHALCTVTDNAVVDEFKELRKAHPKSITWYGTRHPEEDVAECFRLYVSHPELLRELCLRRYRIVDKYALQYMRMIPKAYIGTSYVKRKFPNVYTVLHEMAIDDCAHVNPLYLFDREVRQLLERIEQALATFTGKRVGDVLEYEDVDIDHVYRDGEWETFSGQCVLEAFASSEAQVIEAIAKLKGGVGVEMQVFFAECFDGKYTCDAFDNDLFTWQKR